jgi:hypothetical protein
LRNHLEKPHDRLRKFINVHGLNDKHSITFTSLKFEFNLFFGLIVIEKLSQITISTSPQIGSGGLVVA